ncbi:MAG: transposase [Deltaproteobacteria bacterium]|nr:transposase [Deltaproteobacteria bacterium]
MQRFTKTLSVYPHLHVRVLDGGYLEEDVGTLEFRQDQGPSAGERGALEDEVELRFLGWLRRHGYLEEGAEGRPDDPWWPTAARAP